MFSSESFRVSDFTFRFMTQFKLVLHVLCGVSYTSFMCVCALKLPTISEFVKEVVFPPLNFVYFHFLINFIGVIFISKVI